MRVPTVFFVFICVCTNMFAQTDDVLSELIMQSVDSFYHQFDNSKNENIRDTYKNCTKYVCKDGLPLSFRYLEKVKEYHFHSSDDASIKQLIKRDSYKHKVIGTVFVHLTLREDIITIRVAEVGLSIMSKRRIRRMSSGNSRSYSYKYNSLVEKWEQYDTSSN